jgi:Tfp pilus assembly protein PilF
LPKSLQEFERAAALSPSDYRLWFALGRARERSGEMEGAETALRKALELAPHYAQVQWAFGNLLLRRGKTDEAFSIMRKAVAGEPTFANPAVATAWQIYDGDVPGVLQAAGDSPQAKSVLTSLLARQKRFDEAFQVWNSLPETDKQKTFRPNSDELLQQLLQARKFRDALRVQTQIAVSDADKAAAEKFSNAGFETEVRPANQNLFEWQIADGAQPVIGVDEKQKQEGNRSLVLAFNSTSGQDFRAVQQTVVVAPNTRYKFEVSYRSELKTPATLKWEIIDTSVQDGRVLAATEAVPNNSDWAALGAAFTTSPNTEAVTIRLVRMPCTMAVCPISGKVWFDDFRLVK